jgi:hypothetical protein
MISEIICIGTSYTEGGGLYDPIVKEHYKKNNVIYDKQSEVAWPRFLGKLTNTKVRNLGKCGSGMDYLIRTVETIIENEDVSDKLFILEYSTWGRTELWDSKYNQYIITNWGPRNGEDPTTDGYAVMMTTDYTYGTQLEQTDFKLWETFLDRHFNEFDHLIKMDNSFINLLYKLSYKNIKFKIIYLEPPFYLNLLNDEMVNTNSILMCGDENCTRFGISNLVSEKEMRIVNLGIESTDTHPSIEGHKEIANQIYNTIKNKL